MWNRLIFNIKNTWFYYLITYYNKTFFNKVKNMFKPYIKEDRKIAAKNHIEEMENEFHNMIQTSIRDSVVYIEDDNILDKRNIIVEDIKTEDAVFKYGEDKKLCVLNFASYKYPGGGFIKGAIAQEEALCHASDLYNVISDEKFYTYYEHNRQTTNGGLYKNFAIYSPNIIFNRTSNNYISVDIITCPAPNLSHYEGHCYYAMKAMYDRIKFILDIAEKHNQKNLVLGAFGCGVFKNDPTFVAEQFKELLSSSKYHFDTIIFAIPGGINYKKFKEIFS